MGLFKLDLDHMMIEEPAKDVLWPQLERFFNDMGADKSSFFDLPVKSNWEDEFHVLKHEMAKRIPHVDTFVQVGIGGSSLGAEAIINALKPDGGPKFHFFDNIDPDWTKSKLEEINPEQTLFYIVTKSGSTMETMAQFALIFKWLADKTDSKEAKNHFVFCTDPEQGDLRHLAKEWKVPTFSIPKNLGGRFSALSAVGLFPALVAGIDCNQLLKGAADYRQHILTSYQNKGLPEVASLAYQLVEHLRKNQRNITVMMPYSQSLKTLSSWFVQLWAESLGKGGQGLTPLGAVGATDQHSILQLLRDGPQDKVTGFVQIDGFHNILEMKWNGPTLRSMENVIGITLNQLMDAEFKATRQVLTNNKRPNFTMELPRLNAHTFGQLLFFLETMTAMAGYFLEINPFDQPGVEEGKILAREGIHACKKGTLS